ncbi:hypothetical protein ASPTUDRAFT_191952 [Aspergillus tubingensis CBS 134.48]|uniref:Extracellular membrane protein CFEM domain-containing protein n=1 Tax=Aspergillus tubingensis (strain CBS 134.48) TaxID=767770 RepID=A0A1L9MXF0_ASPTC|nr:hypothetical protein ASPTUDRAFT_191952 [Aspergillus tubingensis CBS 134.48]
MQITTIIALLAANLAVVQGCKCWSGDTVDLASSQDCCSTECWNSDEGSCDFDCLGDDVWDYAICCAAEEECSDCEYGCH